MKFTSLHSFKERYLVSRFKLSKQKMSKSELEGLHSPIIEHKCRDKDTFELVPKDTAEECVKHVYAHHDTKKMHQFEVHHCNA